MAVGSAKKLGHTRPPNWSSSLAIVGGGRNWERRKRSAPFQAGQTGMREYFWMAVMVRWEGEVICFGVGSLFCCWAEDG